MSSETAGRMSENKRRKGPRIKLGHSNTKTCRRTIKKKLVKNTENSQTGKKKQKEEKSNTGY